jgi:Flp pilus assembly protein TadG
MYNIFSYQDLMTLSRPATDEAFCSVSGARPSEVMSAAPDDAAQTPAAQASQPRSSPIRFLRDRRGATALEFGLVLGPTVLTVTVIFQIAYCYFAEGVLDRAAFRGARAVLTGAVSQQGLTQAQFITQYICPELPSNLNCNNIVVNLTIAEKPPAPVSIASKMNVVLPYPPSAYANYINVSSTWLTSPSTNNSNNTFCPGVGSQYMVLQVLYPINIIMTLFTNAAGVSTVNGQQVYWLMKSAAFENEPFSGAAAYAGC